MKNKTGGVVELILFFLSACSEIYAGYSAFFGVGFNNITVFSADEITRICCLFEKRGVVDKAFISALIFNHIGKLIKS